MTIRDLTSDFDDFPTSPHGSDSAHDYYATFTASQALANQLPKINGVSQVEVMRTLMREVQASSAEQKTLFRKSANAKEAAITYWIAQSRQLAKAHLAFTPEFPRFEGITKEYLIEIAQLSIEPETLIQLPTILQASGIVLLFEKSLPGMKTDGAVFRLDSGNPVIVLSLRYDRLDNFWFTLMHELAHIVLHYHMLGTPIIDDLEEEPVDLIEQQADRLGSDSLIPKSDWRGNDVLYHPTSENAISFAKSIGVHPAVVAGRARKELRNYKLFNDIVHELSLREVFFNEK